MVCQYLPWDSDFFGHRIGRVNEHRLTPELCALIEAWSAANSIDCVYLLADSDQPDTVRLAEAHGYQFQDIRVTLDCKLDRASAQSANGGSAEAPHVRPFWEDEVNTLAAISRNAYTQSRFFADSHFPRERCSALYETWIRRSCLEGYADAVFVAELNAEAVGFITCHLNQSTREGSIGLVGVAEQARSKRVGYYLVRHALDWFKAQYMATATVVTQGSNIPAQRLYQKQGFMTQKVQLWYHKWFDHVTPEREFNKSIVGQSR